MVPGVDRVRLEKLLNTRDESQNFQQYLTSNNPDLEVLTTIKAFARQIGEDVSNPLHGEPARIIYFAVIASALLCRTRLTSLTDEQIQDGLEWTLLQPGVEEIAPMITAALRELQN